VYDNKSFSFLLYFFLLYNTFNDTVTLKVVKTLFAKLLLPKFMPRKIENECEIFFTINKYHCNRFINTNGLLWRENLIIDISSRLWNVKKMNQPALTCIIKMAAHSEFLLAKFRLFINKLSFLFLYFHLRTFLN
jgi:hypothetical protein